MSSIPSSLPLQMDKINRRDRVVSDLFSQLPNELKSNILSRLPVEILLQLRCFMDDPYARELSTDQLILASHSNTDVVSFLTLVQLNDEKDCRFHFSEYDVVRDTYKLTKPIRYPPLNITNRKYNMSIIVGSCNGLVCYVDNRRNEFNHVYVFNPVTRERLRITPLGFTSVYGFGYHPVTKEYKVVHIYYDNAEEGEVEVYTLGTGRWRNVGKVPLPFKAFSDSHGVLVNGALHWHDHHNHIASFDLATETFKHVPSPLAFELEPFFDDSCYGLWDWKESLCVVKHNYKKGILGIWVWNNTDQSWGQELSVPFVDERHGPQTLSIDDDDLDHDDCTFITRTESGKVLLWYNHKLLASYDLEKEERTIYGENKANYFNDIVLHVKSFVSLKDLGEDSEIMEVKNLCFLTLIQIDEEKHGRFYLAEYDDVTNEYIVTQAIMHPLLNLRNKGAGNIIVGSCNGLVCYADHRRIKLCVFNPVTRELLNLTPLGSVKKLYSDVKNGFGYHPVTKEYKVVQIYYETEKGAGGEVQVYTLGTGEWRRVGKVPPSLFNAFLDFPGVLVNGALHWVDYKGSIASFDLATEIFKEVPSPSSLTLVSNDSVGNRYNLCALREHLCVIHHFKDSRIDIWELNMDQSWRREFSFAVKVDPPLCANDKSLKHDFCTPVTFTNSGKLLLWYNYKMLAYDRNNEETMLYGEYKEGHFNEIVPHVKSFVSLKALGEIANIIRI